MSPHSCWSVRWQSFPRDPRPLCGSIQLPFHLHFSQQANFADAAEEVGKQLADHTLDVLGTVAATEQVVGTLASSSGRKSHYFFFLFG
jgi:hypothetical protein